MKRLMISVAAAAALSFTALHAQDFQTVQVQFNEPVMVVNNELPAGEYTITLIRTASDQPMLRFQSGDTGKSILVLGMRSMRGPVEAQKTDVLLDRESSSVPQVSRIEVEGSSSDIDIPTHAAN